RLVQHGALDVQVLEYGLDHQIRSPEAREVSRAAHEGHRVLHLALGHAPSLYALLKHLPNRRQSPSDPRMVRVLQPHESPALCRDGGDPGSHEARTKHADLPHLTWCRCFTLDAAVLLQRGRGAEQVHQLLRYRRDRELAEALRLLLCPTNLSVRVSARDHLYRGDRSRVVPAGLFERCLTSLPEHDGATERVPVEQDFGGPATARARILMCTLREL